ncbi:MAG: hypothetical protein K2L02_05475 [Clostridia bacterium]|nr:hypothetical protein [Clostridia bacterium]
MKSYTKGIALILEGATELVFYEEFLLNLSNKNNFNISKETDEETFQEFYEVKTSNNYLSIKLNNVGTITQITNQGEWFKNNCYRKHKTQWKVFLCYDTDSPNRDVSKFNEGDWKRLKDELLLYGTNVVDLAASYDIEDVLLTDLENVLKFLKLPKDTKIPSGKSGKSKMKKLFRLAGKPYHEGERSRELIKSLNFQTIIDNSPEIPFAELLKEIE